MIIDSTKPPPQAGSLEEAQSIIDAAWSAYSELHSQHQKATEKLSAQQKKLNTLPKNPCLPSSSELFKKRKKKK